MASFVVNGENVTVIFDYTAPITIVQETVDDAGRWMFRHYIPLESVVPPLNLTPVFNPETGADEIPMYVWDDLTSEQKLNLLSDKILEFIQSNSKEWFVSEAVRVAGDAARLEAETKYI